MVSCWISPSLGSSAPPRSNLPVPVRSWFWLKSSKRRSAWKPPAPPWATMAFESVQPQLEQAEAAVGTRPSAARTTGATNVGRWVKRIGAPGNPVNGNARATRSPASAAVRSRAAGGRLREESRSERGNALLGTLRAGCEAPEGDRGGRRRDRVDRRHAKRTVERVLVIAGNVLVLEPQLRADEVRDRRRARVRDRDERPQRAERNREGRDECEEAPARSHGAHCSRSSRRTMRHGHPLPASTRALRQLFPLRSRYRCGAKAIFSSPP